ncbi:MAG: class I SAM-dependent methyltransferase [Chloroflexi bacterium]|nr:class I SAM-dependent methyltransferase [Chloroflexota bacterium]
MRDTQVVSMIRARPAAAVTKALYSTRYAMALFRERGCRRVLDVGCGEAYLEKTEPERYVGLDIEHLRLSEARGLGARNLVLGSAQHLPFRDEVFDGVLAKDVLEHFYLEEAFAFLHEVRRVLRRGGIFVVTTTRADQSFWDKPDHVRPYSNKWVRRVLTQEMDAFEVLDARELSAGIPGFGRLGLEPLAHALANYLGIRVGHGIISLIRRV